MAMPRPVPEGGFTFTWTPSVADLNVSVKDFLSTRFSSTTVPIRYAATGALVFSRATGEDRVLLIQRAAHDSMPLRWEIPGGAIDEEDETMLHGLARELWEEAGLRLRHVVRQVGAEHTFLTRSGNVVAKVTCEVEVESTDTASSIEALPEVTLDANEHVRFLWATEEECRLGKVVVHAEGGEDETVDVEFTDAAQRFVVLLGFRLQRAGVSGEGGIGN